MRTERRRRRRVGPVAVVLAVLVTVGCSAGGGQQAASGSAPEGLGSPGPVLEAGADGAVADRPESAGPGPAGAAGDGTAVAGADRSLVRTAELAVTVADPVAEVPGVRAAAVAAGGMIAQEASAGRERSASVHLVLRVPAEQLDRVTDDLAARGEVTHRRSQVVDVTAEVVDVAARVASQQAAADRLRALLAQADSIGDVIAVESELARRESDLDALLASSATLSDRVELATLTVTLDAADAPPAVAGSATFLDGLAAGWSALLAVGVGVSVVVGALLPFLPLVAAAVIGVLWWRRRSRPAALRPTGEVPPAAG